MKKTSAALLAVPLAASLLLSGCSGDPKPGASSSSTARPTSTPTASATPTASPTVSPIRPTDPNIPAGARAHTPAGAEAFVRYFYSQLNVAWSKPQAGLISSMSDSTCKTCTALEGSASDLSSKHQHYRGDVFSVGTVGSLGHSQLLVVGQQPAGSVIDINGSVVKSRAQAQKSKFIVTVAWSSLGWRINEMKVLK